MRRNDREITDREKIREIIQKCYCCRLGFNDAGKVYIVPLSFGYEEIGDRRVFYFHGATEGRKIELIRKTHYAAFELDTNYKLNEANVPCNYSARFQSIIGTGCVNFVSDIDKKKAALQCIMRHISSTDDWDFSIAALNKVSVFKLDVEELFCKEHQ